MVTLEETKWLWEDHVQLGALTIVAGRGHSGKTTFTSDIVATVTNINKNFCDGKPCRHHGSVLYFTLEGRPTDILNKTEAHGGVLSNCGVVIGTPDGDREGEVDLCDVEIIEAGERRWAAQFVLP